MGSDVTLKNGVLGAIQGRLEVGSVTNGVVSLDTTTRNWRLGYADVSGFGDVRLTGRSLLDVGGINAGSIQVQGRQVTLRDGSVLLSQNQGLQAGGEILVNASQGLQVSGTTTNGKIRSGINSETLGSAAGSKIVITTPTLQVLQGGNIITSSVQIPSLIFRQLLKLSDLPSSVAGTVEIHTPNLNLTNNSRIIVKNVGTGKGGVLMIAADKIQLSQNSQLSAQTVSGSGGDISLQTNLLTLQQGSSIFASAGDRGDGGNIKINAPIILGLQNSDIFANAVQGKGGNINITTQGIFGLKYRPQLTPNNDITASSQFGVNGTVKVNTIGVDPNSGLVKLPTNVTDPSRQIASGCSANQGSRFVATGRGGIPQNPNQQVTSDVYDGLRLRTWSDMRDISAYRQTGEVTAQIPPSPEALIQATAWHRNAQGKIELVADKSPTYLQQPLTCAALPRS